MLAESGDTITCAVHLANRMSQDGLINYYYVNIDRGTKKALSAMESH